MIISDFLCLNGGTCLDFGGGNRECCCVDRKCHAMLTVITIFASLLMHKYNR